MVTPIGSGCEEFWGSLTGGVSGIRPITRFNSADFPSQFAGEVQDFVALDYMDRREARRLPRFAQFAVGAARLAIEDGELQGSTHALGACFGSSIGGFSELVVDQVPAFDNKGPGALSPIGSTTFTTHVATSAVCQALDLTTGPRSSFASGCTTGIDVVGWARDQIASGAVDVLVVGATETPLFPFTFGLLCATRGLSGSNPTPRPFDTSHDGTAISEGAGSFIIEELEHALSRGARIYGEILGYGNAGDGGDMFQPSDSAPAALAMQRALNDAGLQPTDLDSVFPFAPGIPGVDIADAEAIRAVLGEHAYHVPVPAVFSSLGHMLSASSLMQIAAMALAIYHQRVPPTLHFQEPARGCDLDCVPGQARCSRLRYALAFSRSLNRTCGALALGLVDSRTVGPSGRIPGRLLPAAGYRDPNSSRSEKQG